MVEIVRAHTHTHHISCITHEFLPTCLSNSLIHRKLSFACPKVDVQLPCHMCICRNWCVYARARVYSKMCLCMVHFVFLLLASASHDILCILDFWTKKKKNKKDPKKINADKSTFPRLDTCTALHMHIWVMHSNGCKAIAPRICVYARAYRVHHFRKLILQPYKCSELWHCVFVCVWL